MRTVSTRHAASSPSWSASDNRLSAEATNNARGLSRSGLESAGPPPASAPVASASSPNASRNRRSLTESSLPCSALERVACSQLSRTRSSRPLRYSPSEDDPLCRTVGGASFIPRLNGPTELSSMKASKPLSTTMSKTLGNIRLLLDRGRCARRVTAPLACACKIPMSATGNGQFHYCQRV